MLSIHRFLYNTIKFIAETTEVSTWFTETLPILGRYYDGVITSYDEYESLGNGRVYTESINYCLNSSVM